MKMSAFVVGGLAGAAAVILWQRNRGAAMAVAGGLGSMLRSRFNGMKEDGLGKMWNMNFGGGKHAGRGGDNFDASDMAHLAEEFIEQDGKHRS